MALKRRVGLVAAAAVGVAVVIAAGVCYLVVRDQLRGQIDNSLRAQAHLVLREGNRALIAGQYAQLPPNAGGPAPYAQIDSLSAGVMSVSGGLTLPLDGEARAVIAGSPTDEIEDITVHGSHLRAYVFHDDVTLGNGQVVPAAVELARPLDGVDNVLSNLRLVLLALCALGIALAAFLGRLAARRVLAPLSEVADTAQQIAETDDLSLRLRIHAEDEVGQLARNFNAMLARLEGSRAALDESVRAQRQLVADASHELRTPVTSLRTNIEVLLAGAQLDDEDRRRLLADVVEQSEELTALVNDLIELARGDQPYGDADDVRLDRVVEESLARARRNAPSVVFEAQLEPAIVDGVPERLERAVNNLLDNAARHSPAGGTVEVTVGTGGVRVRDHGTGVEPAELPYVFDRFFRGASSRGSQGSGLGLAIVRQVAEQHGGHASAENAPDGGAVFTIELPTTAPVEPAAAEPGPEAVPSPAGRSLF
jgi:two-component system, OmpR family, sensor histidine kinase MprB